MHSDEAASWRGDYGRKLAKTAAEESGALRSNSTSNRPVTTFGRWSKERRNAVTPAPLDDFTSKAQFAFKQRSEAGETR